MRPPVPSEPGPMAPVCVALTATLLVDAAMAGIEKIAITKTANVTAINVLLIVSLQIQY